MDCPARPVVLLHRRWPQAHRRLAGRSARAWLQPLAWEHSPVACQCTCERAHLVPQKGVQCQQAAWHLHWIGPLAVQWPWPHLLQQCEPSRASA